jgi:hypothetical protein
MGQLWSSLYAADGIAGQGDEATRIRKWLYGSLLVRDWNADGSTSLNGFTPFDPADNNIKSTLLSASNPGGRWFEVGSLSEDGVEFSPKFSTDETKIWQSRRSQRSDITEDDEEVMFTLMQSTPIVDALRNNQPLSWVTGVEVGQIGYNAVKPNTTDTIYRQLLVIGVDGTIGNAEYCAELRPRVALAKVGKRMFNSKKVDSFEMTYNVFPDPVSGFSATTLRSGPSWVASGGAVVWPSPQTAPVVSGLTSGGKATIVLQQPVSYNDPFTYTVKVSSDSGVTWTNANLDTTFNTVGYQTATNGQVTVKVTGVAAGAKLVQVFATGSNGFISPASSSSTSSTFIA